MFSFSYLKLKILICDGIVQRGVASSRQRQSVYIIPALLEALLISFEKSQLGTFFVQLRGGGMFRLCCWAYPLPRSSLTTLFVVAGQLHSQKGIPVALNALKGTKKQSRTAVTILVVEFRVLE